MTGRSSPPREPPRKVLTADDMRNGIERLKKRIEELTEFAPQKITESHPAQLKALSTSIQTTLAQIFGEGTADYRRLKSAANLQWLPPVMLARSSPVPLANYVQGYDANRKRSLALLQQAVQTLEEDLAEVRSEVHPQWGRVAGGHTYRPRSLHRSRTCWREFARGGCPLPRAHRSEADDSPRAS